MLTAVPLSVAAAVDRDTSSAVAPQLATPSTRISLADGGDTQLTGPADATPVPKMPAAAMLPPTTKSAAVREIRLPISEVDSSRVERKREDREEEAENNGGLLQGTKWVGAAHGTAGTMPRSLVNAPYGSNNSAHRFCHPGCRRTGALTSGDESQPYRGTGRYIFPDRRLWRDKWRSRRACP